MSHAVLLRPTHVPGADGKTPEARLIVIDPTTGKEVGKPCKFMEACAIVERRWPGSEVHIDKEWKK